ncbi:hypothetical protein SC1_01969 [Sphingopyxis sp. C-1]|nr:hypothetical protein SC1_01969 [Sphingopyxis sp. C-1]
MARELRELFGEYRLRLTVRLRCVSFRCTLGIGGFCGRILDLPIAASFAGGPCALGFRGKLREYRFLVRIQADRGFDGRSRFVAFLFVSVCFLAFV